MQNKRLLLKNIHWPFSRQPAPTQRGLRGCGPTGLGRRGGPRSPALRRNKVSLSVRAGPPRARRGPAPRPWGRGWGEDRGRGELRGAGAAGSGVPRSPVGELPARGVGWSPTGGCSPGWWALPREGWGCWGLPAAAPQT